MGSIPNVSVGEARVGISGDVSPINFDLQTWSYTVDGVEFSYSSETEDIDVDMETVPIGRVITKEVIGVTFMFAEGEIAGDVDRSLGQTSATEVVTLGVGTQTQRTVTIEPKNSPHSATGGKRIIFMSKVNALGSLGSTFEKGKINGWKCHFELVDPDDTGAKAEIYDFWDVTMSGNAFAHSDVKGSYRVNGEGLISDVLDGITGGSSGDSIVVRIALFSSVITVTHAIGAGLISLTGSVDFVMNSSRDFLRLTHNGTQWFEDSRFENP